MCVLCAVKAAFCNDLVVCFVCWRCK